MLRLPLRRVGADSSGDARQSSTGWFPPPLYSANAPAPPGKHTSPAFSRSHFWKPEKNFGRPIFAQTALNRYAEHNGESLPYAGTDLKLVRFYRFESGLPGQSSSCIFLPRSQQNV